MSVELSSATPKPKAVASAENHSGKSKVKSDSPSDCLEGGGVFSALLTSLGADAALDGGGQGAAIQIDEPGMPSVSAAASQVATPASASLLPDPSTVSVPTGSTDLAMLLAQAGTVAGGKRSPLGDDRVPDAVGGIRSKPPAGGLDKLETSLVGSVPPGGEKGGDNRQPFDVLLEKTEQGLLAATPKLQAGLSSGSGASLAETRALKVTSLLDAAASEPALPGSLVSSGMGDSILRKADREFALPLTLHAGASMEGSWGHHALLAGERVNMPSATPDPSMLPLESMVAETVGYWVTQGVQNAELTLDGLGSEPVGVSISLKGDEAHISFRTDQPEIRQVLEGAAAHLKEVLTSEGLVLSGVSVGTSGQDNTGSQDRRNRPGVRQVTLAATAVVPTPNHQRTGQSVGRAVDLFV